MNKFIIYFLLGLFSFGLLTNSNAQEEEDKGLLSSSTFSGLEFRNIGPAFMSGRIADVAIHPEDNNTWYVAVGSGGVWKTVNSGTTWTPIFDNQKVYSIGCVTVDPNNPHTVWVGTGENVGGRHVGFGDGIYRSKDGGKSWTNMGLKNSQHISKIIVHPQNSDIIWIAAQGPLWSKGGERGLYKTIDGGKTWKKTLGDDEWVGVTDMVVDPRNPNWLVAATWQRHRNIAAYMGGGPGTALYSSSDGGESWEKLTKGLPTSNMAKIGLAISPQKPDVLYAAIELDRRTGGVYRSEDRGASWEKMSDAVAGATGPHYYQELYASPHQFDRIYLVDVRIQVSDNGGKKFRRLKEESKHSDNHVIVFREDDPEYLLIGTDGGLYESFDLAESWRYIANLPLTQFYKLAVDDAEPFYNIYGGTQDNATQGGPSRTDNRSGIRNSDWKIVMGGDGHQPATEPGNPDIVYCQSQEGELHRVDMITGEVIYIKPQPGADEDYERTNWDAPVLVSPHSPTRIYFASQRLWRSENRGDSWTAISSDLTKNQERMNLPLMDQTWSWDAAWDFDAMSMYNTITSIAESPVQEDLIYIGTDDGLIQKTEDGGKNWTKIEVGALPAVPGTSYVNDIKADLFDASTLYIALDNHKFGDFKPYLVKSTDKGKSWKSIKGDLPDTLLIWRIVQDHINPELLFLGTEFGIYFTLNGGEKWIKFTGGLPTISFRDLAIQKRENDLVCASFGRSFYILDDYSMLRELSEEKLQSEALLFSKDKVWLYTPKRAAGNSQGAAMFTAPNPPFGATFTYYLKDTYKTKEETRKENEKKQIKEGNEVFFPGWDKVEFEKNEEKTRIVLIIHDKNGNVVRRIDGPTTKGINRVTWDLQYASVNPIRLDRISAEYKARGNMAEPGSYTVSLVKVVDGITTSLSDPKPFTVERLRNGALEGSSVEEIAVYRKQVEELSASVYAASNALDNARIRVEGMQVALNQTPQTIGGIDSVVFQLQQDLIVLDRQLNGYQSKREIGEKNAPTIKNRLRVAQAGIRTSYGPTPMHKESFEIASREFEVFKTQLEILRLEKIPATEQLLIDAGAPWIEGQVIPE